VAWNFVGGGVSANSASITRSVTAGNLIIVGYADGTENLTLTISDGVNTWTRIGSQLNDLSNHNSLTWWWASAATTASITVTISGVGGASNNIWIGEWHSNTGNVPANSLEAATQHGQFPTGSGSAATNGDTSNQATSTSNGDLAVGWIFDTETSGTGSAFYTAGTTDLTYTARAASSNNTVAGQSAWAVEDATQTSAGANGANWTRGATDAYGAFVGLFKEAGGAIVHRLLKLGVR
jgi:hypothetical protein